MGHEFFEEKLTRYAGEETIAVRGLLARWVNLHRHAADASCQVGEG